MELVNSTIENHGYGKAPALAVVGVTKSHASRAQKWLKDRSYLAFYRATDKSLNAFEYPQGADWTYDLLRRALEATR